MQGRFAKAIEISEMDDDLKSFGQNSKDMLIEIEHLLDKKILEPWRSIVRKLVYQDYQQ